MVKTRQVNNELQKRRINKLNNNIIFEIKAEIYPSDYFENRISLGFVYFDDAVLT